MKIALLTDGIYPHVMGGMQKHSYYLARYFAKQKIHVELYHYIPKDKANTHSPFSAEELEYIREVLIEYPKAYKFPGHYLFERFQYSKKVLKQLINNDLPDFIYCKGFASWALLKSRNHFNINVPICVNFHGYEMFQRAPDLKTGFKLQILKQPVLYNMRKADFLFSYGGKISEIIKSKGFNNKIIQLPTGISQDWTENNTAIMHSTCIKFCFVGRAERRKGIEELNQVFSKINSQKALEFHFIGPIPLKMRLDDPRIIYHGPIYDQKKIKTILNESDVLVCPSYSEGMPNVILEGMASQCAIIATDVGAISEMVDNHNGWLIEGDLLIGLEEAIIEALKVDSNKLIEMKRKSLSRVKKSFTWEEVIKTTISKIQECIS
jgi:glycosyltransferase involved in cell wall biosynthesis